MTLHTVTEADTLFKIARRYGSSPMKIIEDNDLRSPDELTVGEQLLILSPTRTYTVRGGDTLDRIARTFGVKRNALIAANPSLGGTDRLYPGQILAIRYDAPSSGLSAVNGYIYRDTEPDALTAAMPFLTYATVSAAVAEGTAVRYLFDAAPTVARLRENGKIPLLRVSEGAGLPSYEDRDGWIALGDRLVEAALSGGYGGLTLSFFPFCRVCPEQYGAFLIDLRRRLLGCDLILFNEVDANARRPFPDFADGVVLMYEKCHMDAPPSFADGEGLMADYYASEYESSRMFLDLSPFGYDGDETLTLQQIRRLARRTRAHVETDHDTGLCTLAYPRFHAGRREDRRVIFEAPENIKAKLHLIDAFGYMGVSLDVGRTPSYVWMMVYTTFAHTEGLPRAMSERY